jgi:TRAP-type C4-dicarboxylate transport system permease small subunit
MTEPHSERRSPARRAGTLGVLWVIAANTATEGMRQPIHAILLLLGIGLIIINPLIATFTLGDDDRLLMELGLSTIFLVGTLLAGFSAALALGEEIRRQTVLTVLSKPVSRTTLIVGKYLGVAASLAGAWSVWGITQILVQRHGVLATVRDTVDVPVVSFGLGGLLLVLLLALWENWQRGRSFPSRLSVWSTRLAPLVALVTLSVSRDWALISPLSGLEGDLLGALWLLLLALLLLGAIALAASTRLGTMATLGVTAAAFLIGMVGGALAEGTLLRLLLPNLQLLWVSDGLVRGGSLDAELLLTTTAWALAYSGATLTLATLLFRGRDVA